MSDKQTETDPLADRFITIISEAIMLSVAQSGGFDVHDAEQHKSFLRACGATMALFALSAQAMGAHTAEHARAIVLNGFDSKFDPTLTPHGGTPS